MLDLSQWEFLYKTFELFNDVPIERLIEIDDEDPVRQVL